MKRILQKAEDVRRWKEEERDILYRIAESLDDIDRLAGQLKETRRILEGRRERLRAVCMLLRSP